ncbi:hypothetical protein D3C78_777570 [compost metagenome]
MSAVFFFTQPPPLACLITLDGCLTVWSIRGEGVSGPACVLGLVALVADSSGSVEYEPFG